MTQRKCPSCGSGDCVVGNLEASGAASNVSDFSLELSETMPSWWRSVDGEVNLEAMICMDCGVVTLLGDLQAARRWREEVRKKKAKG
jgi:hypothetical protein